MMMMDGEGGYVEQTKRNSMSRIIFIFMSSYEFSIEVGHSQIKIIPERI